MTIGDWGDLTTVDLQRIDPLSAVAILPLGAVEQHGPHLPLATDLKIAEALMERLRSRRLKRGTALILPALPFGESTEHRDFAGTVTVDAETLIALWCAVGRSVARSGLRRMVLLNTHGGQGGLAEIVALRLRADHDLFAVVANSYHLGTPEGSFSEREKRFGLHAGWIETSLMQHLQPASVQLGAARDFTSAEESMTASTTDLSAVGRARFGWMAQDLNAEGATGAAARGDAAEGAALMDHLTDRLTALLDDVVGFDLDALKPGPLAGG